MGHHFSPFQGFLVLAPVSVPLVDRRLRHLLTLHPHCSSTRTCRFRHGGRCTVRATTTLPHKCVHLLRQLHLPSFSRRPPILSASTAATPLSTRLTQQLGGGCAAQPVHLQPMHRLGGGQAATTVAMKSSTSASSSASSPTSSSTSPAFTTGTGIAINTGEILRKGLMQSLQFHRQGRRTTWGWRRLHPALDSKRIVLDLECANLTHTHTPHTTHNSQVMPTWILYWTSHIQSPNSRTAVRSKSTSRNLGARRWQFRARACALTWSRGTLCTLASSSILAGATMPCARHCT